METVVVESKKNSSLSLVRSLQEKKYRRELSLFFLEGATLFFEALDVGLLPRLVVLSDSALASLREAVFARLSELDVRVLCVSEALYASVSAELSPQGVLGVFSVEEVMERSKKIYTKDEDFPSRYIILEKIQDPGNVGAMMRSAAAFGYRGAILVDSADLFNPKTVRACMGALFHLELFVCRTLSEAREFAAEKGLALYGTSPHTTRMLRDGDFSRPFAMLFGNEGAGMSEEAFSACDETFVIPMSGMESLNAACACAVALYESTRDA